MYKVISKKFIGLNFLRKIIFAGIILCGFYISFKSAFGNINVSSKFMGVNFIPARGSAASNEDFGKFLMSFDGLVKTKISKEKSIPLFYMDILGSTVDVSPFTLNFSRGPVKIIRLNQVSENPPVVRATFFLTKKLKPHVRNLGKDLEISFTNHPVVKEISKSYSLINPSPKRKKLVNKKQIIINVQKANVKNILSELAKQAKKTIHFRDILPENITLNIKAKTPFEAIKAIAKQLEVSCTDEEGDIWISSENNPLLKLPVTDTIEGLDLSKLALGDVLRALGQMAEINIVLDDSLETIKTKPVQMYMQKMSVRRAFETLMKLNNLDIKEIDDKSMIIMTKNKSREILGKVIRIIPSKLSSKRLIDLSKEAIPSEYSKRVTIKEDEGNIVLIGDKKAVDSIQTVLQSLEKKIDYAGESISRAIFMPINAKPEDLKKLIAENIPESKDVKISIDERTDRLILRGPRNSVEKAIRLLKELDAPPTRQALIHIRLIEVTKKTLETYGINLTNNTLAQTPDLGNIKAASFVLPATFEGFNENTDVKTLANPTIRCMDKEEASIDITQQIPVKDTSTEYLPVASSSLAARTSDNWTTVETGIKLNVKPFIHKDNEITMDIDIDQTDLLTFKEDHPWTAKRKVKTKIRVKDKETVVIGGLISRNKDRSRKPIPILSKIPFLNKLFRRVEHQNHNDTKNEMIILITPTVVGSTGLIKPKGSIGYRNVTAKLQN